MNAKNTKFQELVDNIGEFIQYWGFRKIHGRVWAIIYLSNRPLSTPEIVDALGVSKGLISGAINELLEHGLIEKQGQVKFGGITYSACSNPAEVVRDVIAKRELKLFEKIEENLSDIAKFSKTDIDELEINKKSVVNLKELTGYHKSMAKKLVRKKITTMEDWVSFIKRVSKFTF